MRLAFLQLHCSDVVIASGIRSRLYSHTMVLHHVMVGTWTPPGAIFTFEFDDEKLTLNLIKRTPIPEDEPISWMTFDVSERAG